ncbi:fucose-binding protein [Aliigemmobacter aestuarii]|uniref:Fucose-binding protein n=1 Tax=Aliigemmobacter aestuarii TaxID=1445661 RepID=A0A4S3MRA9_9RHOB|nr:RbsD/FucU domain-containing protein [Gemmobacter aestuarii]THD85029.1 fucose-binding protein [Gemmobacter aestuarii]
MLKGIDPRITPDLMDVLMRMGHGDELAVVDSNYPAHSLETVTGRVVEMPGLDVVDTLRVILGLMPLDGFTDHGALWMERDGAGDAPDPVHQAALPVIRAALPDGAGVGSIERQAFYQKARGAFAVVRCTENRPFGCFILRMGVVF